MIRSSVLYLFIKNHFTRSEGIDLSYYGHSVINLLRSASLDQGDSHEFDPHVILLVPASSSSSSLVQLQLMMRLIVVSEQVLLDHNSSSDPSPEKCLSAFLLFFHKWRFSSNGHTPDHYRHSIVEQNQNSNQICNATRN